MRLIRFATFLFFFLGLVAGLSSCNTTKFLGVDEFLLQKNELVLENAKGMPNKGKIKYELTTLYKQNPNTNFFFIPREWFYFRARDREDTSKFDRWVQRVIAEPPAIFDPQLAQATTDLMVRYLNDRGYFNAKAIYDENLAGKKKIKTTYYVNPNRQVLIDTVFYSSEDPGIDSVLQQIKGQSLLKPGAGLEAKLISREKDRIYRHLRNNGYAYFQSNNFAPLEADTTLRPNRANLYFEVLPPPGDSVYTIYHVGEIAVYLDFDPLRPDSALKDTVISGVRFKTPESFFETKASTIINALYLQEGDLFRQENFDKTNRTLSSLGVFRFVRIKQNIDSTVADRLNFRIELTPVDKLEVGVDFELNYTNRSTSTTVGNLIGISVSPSIRNRNVFRGAELLITNLSAGLEVNPAAVNDSLFFNTIDLRLQSQLNFPRFLDYLRLWKRMDRIFGNPERRADGTNFYTLLRENATTRLSASYNYLLLLNFYRYNLFNAYYGFDVQRTNNHRYIVNHLGIDFLNPTTYPDFKDILDSNPFLRRSFGQQLFVSLLFRDFNSLYSSRVNTRGESHYIGTHFEMAGAELWAFNKLYNGLVGTQSIWRLGKTDFSQYLRGEIDLRYYRQINSRRSLASRASAGIALPFGFTSDVPYVKQFFIGGPSSIRAWPARSLGPGGYEDTTFSINNIRNALLFYQSGDIKLELNVEYRFDLFWRIKGAFFLDAGNIWTLQKDTARCGSQFLLSRPKTPCINTGGSRSYAAPFYQQIALGGGFGLRFDFTYFIFRLDMGVRLRNPYPLRGGEGSFSERDYWTNLSKWRWRDANFNIGLGYPF